MITIVPYDSAWPALFAAEAAVIRQTLGDTVLRTVMPSPLCARGYPDGDDR